MNTPTYLDQIFEAYNSVSTYNEVSRSDLGAEDLADMERVVAEELRNGPASLPYALVKIINTSDLRPCQFILMTQESV